MKHTEWQNMFSRTFKNARCSKNSIKSEQKQFLDVFVKASSWYDKCKYVVDNNVLKKMEENVKRAALNIKIDVWITWMTHFLIKLESLLKLNIVIVLIL